MNKLKSFILFIKVITDLILLRPFGNVLFDIAQRYDGIGLSKLRKVEKLQIKIRKAELDLTFLMIVLY